MKWIWGVETAEGWAPIDEAGLKAYASWRRDRQNDWPHGFARLRGEWRDDR